MRYISYCSLAAILTLIGCAAPGPAPQIPDSAKVEDLYIVDCLLPGQVRQLGNTTYLTPRRPTRTTAQDCRIRGGEYVAYDRADYKTALKVWMPAAEGGDADAQNSVGEIFEQGLGTEPNYEVAALWYRRAAQQGHKGAQFNLGTLYEMGKGVPQDKVEALNWYRKAWGVSDDELTTRSSAELALLAQAKETADARAAATAAQAEAEAAKTAADRAREMAAKARTDATAANKALAAAEQQLAEAPVPAAPEPVSAGPIFSTATPKVIEAKGKTFGRYFALVVGNSDYVHWNDLPTPQADADRLATVLQDRYGFQVRRLQDGDNVALLRALNALNDVLEEDDNLLIYYSGHGSRRSAGAFDAGYWLPVNAEREQDTFWLPTEQVAGHLARIKAKRVMVVADSAFAGMLADNPAFLLATDPNQLRSDAYVNLRMPNRSRLLMTSGVDAPVPRVRAGFTSVFADALIEALEKNESVLTAPALFMDLLDELAVRQPELDPEFKAIKRAGDEIGDFFFVAR